jgi:hypothetical protein
MAKSLCINFPFRHEAGRQPCMICTVPWTLVCCALPYFRPPCLVSLFTMRTWKSSLSFVPVSKSFLTASIHTISLIYSERVAFLASRARAGLLPSSGQQPASPAPRAIRSGKPLLFPAYTGWLCVQVADLISIAYARKAITKVKYLESETRRPKSCIIDRLTSHVA